MYGNEVNPLTSDNTSMIIVQFLKFNKSWSYYLKYLMQRIAIIYENLFSSSIVTEEIVQQNGDNAMFQYMCLHKFRITKRKPIYKVNYHFLWKYNNKYL